MTMTPIKVAFFSHSPIVTAMEHYRVIGPLSEAGIQYQRGIKEGHVDDNVFTDSDIILFQRNFSSRFTEYKAIVDLSRKLKKPVVMDLDDYLIGLYVNHPDRVNTPFGMELVSILHAIRDADAITVTTSSLQKTIRQLNPNVFVLPNYLDTKLWSIHPPRTISSTEPIKIVYIGTPSHASDLDSISDSLSTIANTFGNRIAFLFYGAPPPAHLAELENVQWKEPETYTLSEFVEIIQKIEGDIAIAPLLDNEFNRCKSPIKFFEYTAMGMPGVYSDIDAYSDLVEDGINGFLASKQEDWVEKISMLINSTTKRRELIETAQKHLRERWLLHDNAYQWTEVYSKIIQNGIRPKSELPLNNDVIANIAEQLQEQTTRQAIATNKLHHDIAVLESKVSMFERNISDLRKYSSDLEEVIDIKKQESATLRSNIQALENDNTNLKLELVDYATSTSWKITRPFRKLIKYFRRGR